MTESSDTTERRVGNVKWFNNKAGYGFITIGEKTDTPTDVFVHYSNINVSNSQYKYLVQGEYVEFVLTPTPEGPHAFQATAITGIEGGPTLCERRRVTRDASAGDEDENGQAAAPSPVRRQPRTDDRPRGPRPQRTSSAPGAPRRPLQKEKERDVDDEGFKTVKKRRPVQG